MKQISDLTDIADESSLRTAWQERDVGIGLPGHDGVLFARVSFRARARDGARVCVAASCRALSRGEFAKKAWGCVRRCREGRGRAGFVELGGRNRGEITQSQAKEECRPTIKL